jgi:5-methylcytosine-specific restriction endonuclease McrA
MSDPYKQRIYQTNRKLILDAAGYRCQMQPGCPNVATTADHVIPLSAGGTHDLWNLRASCSRCNSQGGARITNQIKQARRVGRRSRRW